MKVNVVSLQTSPGEDTRTFVNQNKELEKKVSQLQQQLDDEIKVRPGRYPSASILSKSCVS